MTDLTPDDRDQLLSLQPGETAVLWRDIEPPVHSQHVRFDVEEIDGEKRFISVCRDRTLCWWAENRDFTPPVQPGETFTVQKPGWHNCGELFDFTIRSVVPADDAGRTRWKIEVQR